MRRITAAFLYLILIAFAISGCASAEKMVDQGEYDRAINLAVKKLSGKDRKNPKLVQAAEEAYAKVTARELREIDRLKDSRDDAAWGRINSLYRNIRKRQEAIRPLLPLTDKNGYTAAFRFVEVDAMEQESRNKAAAYHYDQAQQLLAAAQRGDKSAARAAYRELEETLRYYRNYRDAADLQRQAHTLGISHILVNVTNEAPVVTPTDFDRRLKAIHVADMNTFWQQYHLANRGAQDFDFEIRLRITDIRVTPEVVRERQYTDTKEVEDGWEYVLDNRGNVAKDSLGNDIKVPRKVKVFATVTEVFQQKEALVQGVLEVYNAHNRQLVRTQPLTANAIFENYASTIHGDRRALSADSRRRIGNAPVPFPSNEYLILQAADELKPELLEMMEDNSHFVQL
ncbi:MAG: hypothetical protein R2795_12285 [Saprospiraceae bacterium]